MIDVQTYIKIADIHSLEHISQNYDKYFISCNDENAFRYVKDFRYLEGAVIIVCDGLSVLDFSYRDLTDQLWNYFLNAIHALLKGEHEVSFYFPDQPVKVTVKKLYGSYWLIHINETSCQVDAQEFAEAMLTAANEFFSLLQRNEVLKEIQEIRSLSEQKGGYI